MLADGTYLIMNCPVQDSDKFIKKSKYGYVFKKKPKTKFIIEVEFYEDNILVISFYRDAYGSNNDKYRLRFINTSPIVTLRIFQACYSIFNHLNINKDYALFFHACNDIGQYKEYNDRFSAYDKFLEYYISDYENYKQIGSLSLNIKGIYHKDLYITPDSIKIFYDEFADEIQKLMNEEL